MWSLWSQETVEHFQMPYRRHRVREFRLFPMTEWSIMPIQICTFPLITVRWVRSWHRHLSMHFLREEMSLWYRDPLQIIMSRWWNRGLMICLQTQICMWFMKLTVMAGQQNWLPDMWRKPWKNILMLRELCAEMMTLPVRSYRYWQRISLPEMWLL